MLDTVAITLERNEFAVTDPARFSPSADVLIRQPYISLGARGHASCVNNPTKADLAAGRYMPRLTLTRRVGSGGFRLTLRVEFSAPKLLFGNNFDELRSQDFDAVVSLLAAKLAAMGVRVCEDALRGAGVSAVHYGKNIPITDYATCSMILADLAKIDLSRRLDLSRTDFRNEGHALRYHTNTMEVVFYDKVKDLQQARISEKRAIEDDNAVQGDLFSDRSRYVRPLEVLRMEVRLGNRTKIRDIFARIGVESQPTFAGIFDASVAKAALLHFWANVRAAIPMIASGTATRPEEILEAVRMGQGGTIRPTKALQQVGYIALVNSVGMRAAAAALSRCGHARSAQRIKRELGAVSMPAAGYTALKQVDAVLEAFEPLRMRTFEIQPAQGSVEAGRENGSTGRGGSRGKRARSAPRARKSPARAISPGELGMNLRRT